MVSNEAIVSVVICFHFSIFEPQETVMSAQKMNELLVVICFHFSIFEPQETVIIEPLYD